ncbi:single-stranded DNA-binding protein [Bremerella sp. T1]|uniref:single-stranded DNA-binding protein n=1 Tax=Bremerella sp. TYQ1 TaxID=3119568 RepID=UPI001CCDAEA7|nr:single-stranded DNA-binding protein [Bremerella volcania]UBM35516.1 single-stranded DNA-binding protein [Bremerella volcania]
MASFNRVILVGNLTRDIDLRYVSGGGTAVTELGLAVNDRRKTQSGEWVDETTFVDVTLWGRTAEIASEYLSKGAPVLIEGRLKLDTWETDGQKRSKLRVVGEKMQMLGGRDGSGGGGSRGGSRPPQRQSQPQGGGGYGQGGSSDYDSYDDGSFGGQGSQGAADDDIPF